jgi:small-conductance mechanosensitive channel
MKQKHLIVSCVVLLCCLCLSVLIAHGNNNADGAVAPVLAPTQASDPIVPETDSKISRNSTLSMWLHMLDKNENVDIGSSSVMAFAPQVPGDLARILKTTGGDKGAAGFLKVFFLSIVSLGLGFLIVFGAKRLAKEKITKLEQISPPGQDNVSCLWAGLIRCIPALIGVILLAFSATLLFLFLAGSVPIEGRMLFQLILGIVLVIKISLILGQVIFSPGDARVRPLSFSDSVAKSLYHALVVSVGIILSAYLFITFIKDLGALEQTVSWVGIVLGTFLIVVLSYLVIYLKTPISESLQAGVAGNGSNRIKEQFAAYWHVPALLYLFSAWFIWVGREMSGIMTKDGTFLITLFIVPIFIVLSYAGNAVIRPVIDSLGLGTKIEPGSMTEEDEAAVVHEFVARKKAVVSKTYLIFRIVLAAALTTWTLTLWGYDIPFAADVIKAIFQSLIILALALTFWRFASAFIERKIEEATPEPSENAENDDNEFGGAVPEGRSYTLLPMLRKVLASTLIIMVILIVLSTLGVNIAPLLAGAGVLGLAVGFGAQKLVSDILSGFFFLLDDAFRVGEYIQTGSIKGTVETITLRNVMLRHHRGMLQVVPHSDLGAVTNYMRGGIVIKFPLEFPYDTDIDKVRKIIKNVGQAMLTDEEIGGDFLQPVKSQGVNEITNSVMVIRVKFTAKPGKQFVIKREAFRRITEALNAKGIYYAHRKVIVDFPEESQKGLLNEETRKKALEAGAASVIANEEDQQKEAVKEKE